jgi:hypothetical protein
MIYNNLQHPEANIKQMMNILMIMEWWVNQIFFNGAIVCKSARTKTMKWKQQIQEL